MLFFYPPSSIFYLRLNSKIGVTQAEAGKDPVTQKWCYPNSLHFENEGDWGTMAGQLPSLPFFG
jgi:hypothetical protein